MPSEGFDGFRYNIVDVEGLEDNHRILGSGSIKGEFSNSPLIEPLPIRKH